MSQPININTFSYHSIQRDTIMKEGFMVKRGSVIKNLKRRWFVLTSEVLYYFDEPKAHLKGYIQLAFATVTRNADPRRPTFDLTSPTQSRTFFITVWRAD